MVETINKTIRVQRQLVQELGREPEIEELAAETDMSPEKVRNIMRISQHPVSLEKPIGEEEDSHLGDFISNEIFLLQSSKHHSPCLKSSLMKSWVL